MSKILHDDDEYDTEDDRAITMLSSKTGELKIIV